MNDTEQSIRVGVGIAVRGGISAFFFFCHIKNVLSVFKVKNNFFRVSDTLNYLYFLFQWWLKSKNYLEKSLWQSRDYLQEKISIHEIARKKIPPFATLLKNALIKSKKLFQGRYITVRFCAFKWNVRVQRKFIRENVRYRE